MQYRRLGRSGLKLSELALGAGNWGYQGMNENAVRETVALALDAGINYFDNAESYTGGRAEEIMGRVFRSLKLPRLKAVVSTKYYWGINDGPNSRNTLNRKYLIDGIDGSLKRLQMDYVDIVYCHRNDPHTPIEETVWAMHNIIEWGKALYWGTSEWRAEEIRAAWDIAERHHLHKPVVEQPEYNLLRRSRVDTEHRRLLDDIGLGIAVFSPLAGGTLTGKYRGGAPADSRAADPSLARFHGTLLGKRRNDIVDGLEQFARQLDCSLTELALAWILTNPRVSTAILGVSRPAQLSANLKALDVVPRLTPDILAAIAKCVGDYSEPWSTVTDPQ
ncbi:aldo/keto reductase [Ramlibacter sp. WS9]|uniref:aldo/keto reductase n=1 Tax=Ramlibacter sp. WS9 TaxID=1882741 RepID=UPI00114385E7|nr:aldo/keto reductase [Ramlibacter sp. WS9]ROZ69211.1 aldo/keto reductase [Ramlibacter sp. WS9]